PSSTSPRKQNFSVLEEDPVAQEHAKLAVETFDTVQKNIKKLIKEFKINRWYPDHPTHKPYLQSYYIDLSFCGPMEEFLGPAALLHAFRWMWDR
ncbi:hypothetical protein CFOL_v3_34857, partial [Cephalotus follicularis]